MLRRSRKVTQTRAQVRRQSKSTDFHPELRAWEPGAAPLRLYDSGGGNTRSGPLFAPLGRQAGPGTEASRPRPERLRGAGRAAAVAGAGRPLAGRARTRLSRLLHR